LSGTGAYTGGTYAVTSTSGTPVPPLSGLIINTTTGSITPSLSTPGTYTVTYTTPASGSCASVPATATVTITELPNGSFDYDEFYCNTITAPQAPEILTGIGFFTGGFYNSVPPGLTINTNNGEIVPNTSTPGVYAVTYTIPAAGGCPQVVLTSPNFTITPLPTATISYNSATFCNNVTTQQQSTLTGTGAYTGGVYSSTTGLTLSSTTGAITPSSSTPGTYTITYTTPASGGCASVTATATVTIIEAPTASITYPASPYCTSLTTLQSPTLTGSGSYLGGTYTSTAGLSLNASTGEINPNLSTAGTYTVTYTTVASGGCAATTATATVTITVLPTSSISYTSATFCSNLTTQQLSTLTGTGAYTGGVYSSTTGLTLNATTGAITPSSSTPGTYTITYTTPVSGGCASITATATVTIIGAPTASITYPASPYCTSLTTLQSPTLTGSGSYLGGTYTSTAGLSLNASTGAINPSLSTAGTYTVTYTTVASGGCAATTATATVTITQNPSVAINYSNSNYCNNSSVPIPVSFTGGVGAYTGGTFSSTPFGLSLNSLGEIIPNTSAPGTYTITYTIPASGGCSPVSTSTTVTIVQTPTAILTYNSGTSYCTTITTPQAPILTGTGLFTGGTYSSAPVGLTLNAITGAITPSTSTPGTYNITYSLIPSGSGCPNVTTTATVVITQEPTVSINYPQAQYCNNLTTSISIALNGTGSYTGGTYSSSPDGLQLNINTGEITPNLSLPGIYIVTYTTSTLFGCAAITQSTQIEIVLSPTASINYGLTIPTAFCANSTTNQPVNLSGTGPYTGGTFTASPTGLIIDAGTGAITPSLSTPGSYTVTYSFTALGGCSGSATTTVNIDAVPQLNAPPLPIDICTSGCTTVSIPISNTLITPPVYSWSSIPVANPALPSTPSIFVCPTATTTYTLNVTSGVCSSSASIVVNVIDTPIVSIGSDTMMCVGGSMTFTATVTGGVGTPTYTWYVNNTASPGWVVIPGANSSTYTTNTFNQTGTILYQVAVDFPNGPGCGIAYGISQLTILPDPIVSISPDVQTLCVGGTPDCIQATVLGGVGTSQYFWNPPLSTTDILCPTNSTTSVAGTDIYTLSVIQSGLGCSAQSNNAIVNVINDPVVTISGESEVCVGAQVPLTATVSGGLGVGVNYIWSVSSPPGSPFSIIPGAISSTYTPPTLTSDIEYSVSLDLTGEGCGSNTTLLINVNEDPVVTLVAEPYACYGESVEINTIVTGGTPNSQNSFYWYSFDGLNNQYTLQGPSSIDSYTYSALTDNTIYVDMQSSSLGCDLSTDNITVQSIPYAIAGFSASSSNATIFAPTFSFFNESQNATEFIWDLGECNPPLPPDELFIANDFSQYNFTYNPTNYNILDYTYRCPPGQYYVTLYASNMGYCPDSVGMYVTIQSDQTVYVPNSFTPNGDEFNNVFLPVISTGREISDYELLIFNRWGEVIFESHDINIGWDGTYGPRIDLNINGEPIVSQHGKMAQDGVYIWTLNVVFKDKGIPIKEQGHVNLLR
jgi:gliding motility-associated-like protein